MATNVRLNITKRIEFADGMSFGDAGPYERLVGTAHYAVDPDEPRLQHIVDLDLAPRNADGLVEFSGDLDILKPVDVSKGNKRLLYEVSNRGNRSALRSFNDATPSADPKTVEDAGNGYLMRQGYSLVLSGWQGDHVPGTGIVAELPEAKLHGESLRGTVRQEFIIERAGVLSQPVSGAPNIQCYPVVNADTATLTAREHEADPRQPVPRDEWDFAKAEKDASGEVKVTPSNVDLYVKDGFKPGWIYELIYDTEGSRVMGLGPAGIRDLISFFRHEDVDAAGTANPFAGNVEKAYAYGGSLSARVVRQFVYEGFNEDSEGRQVFEAIYPHLSGGGRVWINQRFAQVGRFPRQHEEHTWPSERYPFAYSEVPDLFTEKLDSVLKRPGTDPLVMHTHSATEYWQRHAALGQLDLRSGEDIDAPETVRMYFLSSFPHGAAASAPAGYPGQQHPNGLAAGPFFRACLELMDRWATDGTPPPPSRLPKRTDGTLATADEVRERFPKVPGRQLPRYSEPPALPRLRSGVRLGRRGQDAAGAYRPRVPDLRPAGRLRRQRRRRTALARHRGAGGHVHGLDAAARRFCRRRSLHAERQLHPLRPHARRTRIEARPTPVHRRALREP